LRRWLEVGRRLVLVLVLLWGLLQGVWLVRLWQQMGVPCRAGLFLLLLLLLMLLLLVVVVMVMQVEGEGGEGGECQLRLLCSSCETPGHGRGVHSYPLFIRVVHPA